MGERSFEAGLRYLKTLFLKDVPGFLALQMLSDEKMVYSKCEGIYLYVRALNLTPPTASVSPSPAFYRQ